MFKRLFVIILMLGVLQAENNAVDFLQNGVSARALGMGAAFTAVAEQADGVFYNPAGLASSIKNVEFASSGANNFSEVDQKNISVAWPAEVLNSVFALNISNSLVKDIPKTYWVEDRPVQDGSFNSEKNNYTFSYGQRLNNYWYYGINLRKYSQTLDVYSAEALGVDAGVLYALPKILFDNNVMLGVVWHNIGRTNVNWSTGHQDSIPMRFDFGAALYRKFFERKLVLSTDVELEEDQSVLVNNGVEYWLVDNCLALRTGSANGQLTYGLGIKYFEVNIDYAQADYHELGLIKKVSVGVRF